MDPLLYETHSHTTLCKHAVGTPEEYAETARLRGLRGLIITCHNPMPDGFSENVRMSIDEFPSYVAMVQQAAETYRGRVDVRLGLECDYFPGFESWLEQQVESADFHYLIGSVHPHIHDFRQRFWCGDPLEYQRRYFEQLAAAAETRLFDCISHPDLIKNETCAPWQPEAVMDDIRRALDRIAATGTAMELNTSGANKRIAEMNPFPGMLREMQSRGIPVVIGGDAHEPARVGDGFVEALRLLEECGYDHVSLFLNRRRQDVPVQEALRSLAAA